MLNNSDWLMHNLERVLDHWLNKNTKNNTIRDNVQVCSILSIPDVQMKLIFQIILEVKTFFTSLIDEQFRNNIRPLVSAMMWGKWLKFFIKKTPVQLHHRRKRSSV